MSVAFLGLVALSASSWRGTAADMAMLHSIAAHDGCFLGNLRRRRRPSNAPRSDSRPVLRRGLLRRLRQRRVQRCPRLRAGGPDVGDGGEVARVVQARRFDDDGPRLAHGAVGEERRAALGAERAVRGVAAVGADLVPLRRPVKPSCGWQRSSVESSRSWSCTTRADRGAITGVYWRRENALQMLAKPWPLAAETMKRSEAWSRGHAASREARGVPAGRRVDGPACSESCSAPIWRRREATR